MRKNWLLGALSVGTIAIVAPAAHAEGRNEVQAVTFAEANGVTTIRIRGSEAALFTAYKLERPARVVIDLAQSRLAEVVRGSHETGVSFAASTWAVSSINAQQIDDGGALVRMTINLARPGRYDVKMDGNDLLLTITARDAAPKVVGAADVAAARAEADAAKRQGVATRAELDAAKRLGAQAVAEAEAAKRQGAATRVELDAAKRQGAQAQAQAERAQIEADRLRVQAADLAKRAQLAEQAATQAQASRAGNTASDKKALAQAQADAAQARNAAMQAARNAQAALSAASVAAADAETAKQREALARAAAQREVRTAQADASAARDIAAHAQAELAQVKLDAAMQRAQAERMLAQANAKAAQVEAQSAQTKRIADQAKAALDTASAREKAAQAATEQAQQAQRAAVQAERATKSTSNQTAVAERDRLAQEATAAQQRVALARAEMVEAKREREAAAREAAVAKAEVQKAKQQLAEAAAATVAAEQQRALAISEAQRATAQTEQAERRRAAAEAQAATAGAQSASAVRTRSEAEAATQRATATRATAERAARDATEQRAQAELAAQRAKEQRIVAEQAATKAQHARLENERGIAELTARRAAMTKADDQARRQQVDARNAEAELAAAVARKASQSELTQIKAEAAAARRDAQQAQVDVAKRTAALATQQAEVDRLKQVATAAREAADREDLRRTALADERVAMERETTRLQQAATAAKQALATVPAAAVAVVASKPVAAPAPAAKVAVASITDVRFEGDEGSGRIAITVRGDVKLKLGEATARRAELLIDDSQLAATLERKLDVSRFDGPVRSVSSYRDRTLPNRVRVVVELASDATPTLERNGNVVRWNFVSTDGAARSASTTTTRNIPPPVMGGFGVATPAAQSSAGSVSSRRRVFRGPPVTLDFKEAPIHDLLRLLSELNRVNIVVPDDIADKVTVRMNRVPWDQALEVILSSKGLWYRREGNLYRIAKRADLDAEDEKEAARRKAAIESESPEPEVLTLNYASAGQLKGKLEPLLSPKGKIEVDDRTNSLIVNDLRSNRQRISSLALQLDTQTPQISIEARIVEARSDFKREFGVQWGGGATAGVNGGNATGLLFPSSIAVAGGARDNVTNSNGLASPSDFAVNLPAKTGTGSGGALGLSLGSLGGNFNLGLRLSALEDSGTVRIISAPKITVLNNESANIAQGVKIPIQVTGAAGTQTSFVDAKLELKVKPYVSQRDCAIAMDIEVTKNEADFVNTGARGDPTILTKEVKTKILINDGETTVLGGIYTRNTGLAYNKVPFFGDLPVIGWFFKKRSENDNRSEVLIFITPKITNKAFLRCQ
ncbi:MAG: type IV pilus secretin PilQ [Kofleriaceae bacterium]|nr:type IV pilus secretin PilQ [Kofleriaceae bacterium]